MKVGVIGAGTMGQGIAKAFAQVDGYTVALCDIKQEWAEGGKDKIAKGYARLVQKEKMTQEQVDGILARITPGLKEDLCADCDLIVEAAFENMEVKKIGETMTRNLLEEVRRQKDMKGIGKRQHLLSLTRLQSQSVSSLLIHLHFLSQRLEMVLHVL